MAPARRCESVIFVLLDEILSNVLNHWNCSSCKGANCECIIVQFLLCQQPRDQVPPGGLGEAGVNRRLDRPLVGARMVPPLSRCCRTAAVRRSGKPHTEGSPS